MDLEEDYDIDQVDADYDAEFVDPADIQEELVDDGDAPMSDDENENIDGDVFEHEIPDDSIQGFFEHRSPVYSVEFNRAYPNLCASGGGDDKSYLWNCETGDVVYPLGVHTDSVSAVSFSEDGKVFILLLKLSWSHREG